MSIHTHHSILKQPDPFEREGATVARCFRIAAQKFASNNFLGQRTWLPGGKRGPFEWITYGTANEMVTALGSGLRTLGIQTGDKIGIMSKNCPEWLLVDLVCATQSLVCVPVYDSYTRDECEFICRHSEIRAFFCTQKMLPFIIEARRAGLPNLQFVIVIDSGPTKLTAVPDGATHLFTQLLELGRAHPHPDVSPAPEDLFTIVYTSGTTGSPKGAMLTHKNVLSSALMLNDRYPWPAPGQPPDCMISYLPLAHIFERELEHLLINFGACFGYWQGSVATLSDDLATLKPSVIPGVPRVYSKLYSAVMAQIQSTFFRRTLFRYLYSYKEKWWRRGEPCPNCDRLLFSKASESGGLHKNQKIRAKLGGNVRYFYSGSAPLSPELATFVNYGLTETAASITCVSPFEKEFGTVGYPYPGVQVMLADVPEMDYHTTDRPCPRGEILVRGDQVFVGYYKDPDKTAEVKSPDGWFRTGDVGMWVPGPDGDRLKIIDRVKNIFKLSQGEFVCAERLEAAYLQYVPAIQQIMVYGQPTCSALVAVVVPNYGALLARPEIRSKLAGIPNLPEGRPGVEVPREVRARIAMMPEAKAFLLGECRRGAEQPTSGIRRFEFIKDMVLCVDEWTAENKLMTPSFKMRRDAIKTLYARDLQAMMLQQEAATSFGKADARPAAAANQSP